MKLKLNNFVLTFLTLMLMVSCSSTKVISDLNSSYSFNSVKSYAIKYEDDKQPSSVKINVLNKSRIERYITQEMNDRGLVLDAEQPDVILVYSAKVDVEHSISSSGSISTGSTGRRGHRSGFASGSKQASLETNTNGILTIEMKDAENNNMVWYSQGNRSVDNKKAISNKADEFFSTLISKMMNELPIEKVE